MAQSASVAIVILAAGGSRRMGRPKQLLPLGRDTLLRHAVRTAVASQCRPIIVTIGAHEDLIRSELHAEPLLVARNLRWEEGLSSSLRAAIDTLVQAAPHVDGVVITLADQPLVSAADINRLVNVHRRTGKDIVASEYAGTRGVPMFLGKRLFGEVATLHGDEGAKRLIARHPELVASVPLPSAAFDIDTPSDYEDILRSRSELKVPTR